MDDTARLKAVAADMHAGAPLTAAQWECFDALADLVRRYEAIRRQQQTPHGR